MQSVCRTSYTLGRCFCIFAIQTFKWSVSLRIASFREKDRRGHAGKQKRQPLSFSHWNSVRVLSHCVVHMHVDVLSVQVLLLRFAIGPQTGRVPRRGAEGEMGR
jgi:hypothetical protein